MLWCHLGAMFFSAARSSWFLWDSKFKNLSSMFTIVSSLGSSSNTDVHTVASLLKLYLRELPEPVIPFYQYEDFLTCAQLLSKDEEEVCGPCVLWFSHLKEMLCMITFLFHCTSGGPGARETSRHSTSAQLQSSQVHMQVCPLPHVGTAGSLITNNKEV